MCTARSINSSSQVDLLAWHKQQWKHPASLLYSWRSSQTRGIIEGETSILSSSMFQIACPEETARPRGISQQGIHQCMVTFRALNYLWSEISTFWCTFIARYLILQYTKCIISTHEALQAYLHQHIPPSFICWSMIILLTCPSSRALRCRIISAWGTASVCGSPNRSSWNITPWSIPPVNRSPWIVITLIAVDMVGWHPCSIPVCTAWWNQWVCHRTCINSRSLLKLGWYIVLRTWGWRVISTQPCIDCIHLLDYLFPNPLLVKYNSPCCYWCFL